MKNIIHTIVGFELSKFEWYRKWCGGLWTLVYVTPLSRRFWVKDYKYVKDAVSIREEQW